MPRNRVSVKKIKEVLRLKWQCNLSDRQVAQSCKLGKTTVGEYVQRAVEAGLSWPLPADWDDAALSAKLFGDRGSKTKGRPLPDWSQVHKDLKRKGVTLLLLWHEYKAHYPEGYEYSSFTVHYRKWKQAWGLSMRQTHRAGEKLLEQLAKPDCIGEVCRLRWHDPCHHRPRDR